MELLKLSGTYFDALLVFCGVFYEYHNFATMSPAIPFDSKLTIKKVINMQ